MQRLFQVLFWSVIAAAFVGPGTVTTCARAGANYGLTLLWAVAFSTIACFVLQEASARITAVSGLNLGQAMRQRHHGFGGTLVLLLVLGGIVGGCAAYQAGNLVGAAAGSTLLAYSAGPWTIGAATLFAAALLWTARTATVAKVLGGAVALMGLCFAVTAMAVRPDLGAMLRGLLVPGIPDGAGLLVVALIGTTVVPYNLFLGSGIARGQRVGDMRFGLAVSVGLGGLISLAIVVVGSSLAAEFSFGALGDHLAGELGAPARILFAGGLFCAGLTSAITAPLAAALTARGLFAGGDEDRRWSEDAPRYRAVWLVVLLTGAGFALAATRPAQLIVVAQALNGVLLPFVAMFLLLAVNDRRLMGQQGLNPLWANLLSLAIVGVTLLLGLSKLLSAVLGRGQFSEETLWVGAGALALATMPLLTFALVRSRRRPVE